MSIYDITFKQGEKGVRNAVLIDTAGNLIDLTPYTVTFVMKNSQTNALKDPISCTLGCTYNGIVFSAARGGVTIPFDSTHTADAGLFEGEWILTSADAVYRVPDKDNGFVQIMIWENIS